MSTLSDSDLLIMCRCFELARLGAGKVSPNPMVGAVILQNEKIISEGYHKKFGGPHAEVNAIGPLLSKNDQRLRNASIYISLEPCCFFGKTPPCTDLIINSGITNVIVSAIDKTAEVSGKGIGQLLAAGLDLKSGVAVEEGNRLSAVRNIFVKEQRPYIILKYAQSRDGFMGRQEGRLAISNPVSHRLVHKWRSEVDAILIGTNTAEIDNPQLSTRFGWGRSPLRLVLDRQLRLSRKLHLFDGQIPTRVITEQVPPAQQFVNTQFWQIPFDDNLLKQLLHKLYSENISSLLVEGGRQLLQSFLDEGLWDEARIFTNGKILKEGCKAPVFPYQKPHATYSLLDDRLDLFYH